MHTTAPLRRCATSALVLGIALCAGACSKPEAPPTDQQPEPQAGQPQAGEYKETHTELNDAIQRPINKAKAVDAEVQAAEARRKAEIDAQTGG